MCVCWQTGRADVNIPRVCGHRGAITDIKWNPFDDNIIASSSEDATVTRHALLHYTADNISWYQWEQVWCWWQSMLNARSITPTIHASVCLFMCVCVCVDKVVAYSRWRSCWGPHSVDYTAGWSFKESDIHRVASNSCWCSAQCLSRPTGLTVQRQPSCCKSKTGRVAQSITDAADTTALGMQRAPRLSSDV